MVVTTIIDSAFKLTVTEITSYDCLAWTGGTVKGLGTTYFNTVITSVPAIRDVMALFYSR